MDFYQIRMNETKNGIIEISPDFEVGEFKDLMIRGGKFYAIWDEARGMWTTDHLAVPSLVDQELSIFADEMRAKNPGNTYIVKPLSSFNSNTWLRFLNFTSSIGNSSHQLDENLTFANTEVKKSDYVSRRLPYSLAPGDYSAWEELIGTCFSVTEKAKIEWAIGAIISGDAKKIQKFVVLYGPAGTGKSTVLSIVQKLFEGYTSTFEAKALGSSNNTFSTEVFKNNPLVAIQHDGDLSKIDDNTKLNSIISHEEMTMNEKFKSAYSAKVNAFLLMGTNQPVKISNSKSGIIRRLIDVHPTGVILPVNHYTTLLAKIDFELGAIASHCLEVYLSMGKNYYIGYRPLEMMLQTDMFFNFIEVNFDIFKAQDGVSLSQAYLMYKEYCAESNIDRILPRYKFREELRNYFDEFYDRATVDDAVVRSYYKGFNANKFKAPSKNDMTFSLVIEETESILDKEFAGQPAQYAKADGSPKKYWSDKPILKKGVLVAPTERQIVNTVLSDIDTSKEHFVKVPENHIVIDFDLKDEHGEKSLERNLEAASNWPATYAELSKGGSGVHLHYNYDGDVSELSSAYSEGIEVKTLLGDAALRRRLTKCNNVPVVIISSGLPIKEKKMLNASTVQTEKGLRDLIARNLRKDIHPATKPSVDFIKKILDDAYVQGLSYDVTDLRGKIMAFANNSTNHPFDCLKVVQQMQFKGQEIVEKPTEIRDERIVIFDVEVYPNLFIVCWKYRGDPNVVRMRNPTPQEVEQLFGFKLMGFNNRRYDNHILYARYMGYDNMQLFKLSQKLISNDKNATFGEAYNISYGDIWDISSKKQTLKRFMIELGIHHSELNLPWDEDVTVDMIEIVEDYCANDVVATEAVLEAQMQDFVARQILADLSELSVNDTTQRHTAKIIFGNDKNPQTEFLYTDLSKEFPGYTFDSGKSYYRDELVGEGGYVYSEPGMYENVAVLDIASMHPTTIEQLNLFGDYTPKFSALKAARMAIKHKDYNAAKEMYGGKLAPYLVDEDQAKALSYALKIVINIVYGLTSAKFENPFRDNRNIDNIVAKRGALFMIDLKHFVEELNWNVIHIKTDSIKIANPTPELIEDIIQFGQKYGYEFEYDPDHDWYDKFCLVNDAVYIARSGTAPFYNWEAVGAQFQHPYIYKTLFTHEPIEYKDLCEAKYVVKGGMYLDFEYDRPAVMVEGMHFVGRSGLFIPVKEGCGGAMLYRVVDDKIYAVSGTKGYLWVEAGMGEVMIESDQIDMSYYDRLVDAAKKTIEQFGEFDRLFEVF